MALNIAVHLSGIGEASPISSLELNSWENVKALASPIGSESSGVSSLDPEEIKMQQIHVNNRLSQFEEPSPTQETNFALELKKANISGTTDKLFNQNLTNTVEHCFVNGEELNKNLNNNNHKTVFVINKAQDLKIMYNGRDILDLGANVETNPKIWNLKYTYLPENNNIPMFLANRSQYHRLGANGHIQEYTLYHCSHCDFQFPVMCNTANFMAQTSLNVTFTRNAKALYTNSSNSFRNDSLQSSSQTNVTYSTNTTSTSTTTNSKTIKSCEKVSNSIESYTKEDLKLSNGRKFPEDKGIHQKQLKKIELTKEELNECDFSYVLRKILPDSNSSINNAIQSNSVTKCNNISNVSQNHYLSSIFSHSVAAVAAAAALSPQLSSQTTSPSCCSSSGYSSNGSTNSLSSIIGGGSGIKYPIASLAPNYNNTNYHNINLQNNLNAKNGTINLFQINQNQSKTNFSKVSPGTLQNNSINSLLSSLNGIKSNNNNDGNNSLYNNCYANHFLNNSNPNLNTYAFPTSGANQNNNITNQINGINYPSTFNQSANSQNFTRVYKYF